MVTQSSNNCFSKLMSNENIAKNVLSKMPTYDI